MTLLTPFSFEFMWVALGMSLFVGAVCAIFSCYLVLKGWSLMGDAISHAVLPGIVLAFVAGVPLAIGAFVSGLGCALGTGYIKQNSRLKEDTVLGVVFTGLFALGLVLFVQVESDQHLNHILFGNLLGIERNAIWQTLGIGVPAALVMLVRRKDLLLFCFDPQQARGIGLNTTALNLVMLSLLAATIVAGLQAVGVILVVAMLITPGAVGFLLCRRFSAMLVVAVATACTASAVGVYVSFFINGSTAACIVLVQTLLFVAAFLFAPGKGWLAQRRQTRQMAKAAAL
ncbi:metal ABC transporter permease [Nibricoccus sp. IMCC34717]|uniref:metal ABC transporter permease n=1 Tax=Nibricoccus sp. IMCC34717 TaxID=3034021 RepID=UPI00384FB515